MSDTDRRKGGARLPMILLAVALVAVGGTAVWLQVSGPPVPHAKPGTRLSLDGSTPAPGGPASQAHGTAPGGHGEAAAKGNGHTDGSPKDSDHGGAPAEHAAAHPEPAHPEPTKPAADAHGTPAHPAPAHPEPAHPAPAKPEPAHAEPAHPQPSKPAADGHGAPAAAHTPAPSGHGEAPKSDAHAPSNAHASPPAAHGTPADSHGAAPADSHGAAPTAASPSASHGVRSETPANPPSADKSQTAARPVAPKPLPRVRPDAPLKPAPDPALVQDSSIGPLPRVGDDGRMPWRVYAKPFSAADGRPLIAIVISGLGLSAAATESAIQGLPGGVTLAFAPYGSDLNGWIRLARAAGHEVLLNVPMEPTNYPAYDPGPQTLLTSLNAQGNLDRLLWILSRGTGYVGVVDYQGSRFTASRPHLEPVMAALRERGLLFLDSGTAARAASEAIAGETGMPWAIAALTLDDRASRVDIDRKFAELERIARRDKKAVAIGSAYPVTLERVQNWTRQLEARGFAIAPVSAIAGAPKAKKEARQ